MEINKIYTLDESEQKIVELCAMQRQYNKIKTGWDGHKTVNKKSSLDLNIAGFGGEFIFCREFNLYPDFKIHNTSKELKTDDYDANWNGLSVDIKVNRKKNHPLMIPKYAKSDCKIFALFTSNYPKYIFEGFTLNNIIFQDKNLRMTRVEAYVIEKENLLSYKELNFLLNF
jgi:hypothetical protein